MMAICLRPMTIKLVLRVNTLLAGESDWSFFIAFFTNLTDDQSPWWIFCDIHTIQLSLFGNAIPDNWTERDYGFPVFMLLGKMMDRLLQALMDLFPRLESFIAAFTFFFCFFLRPLQINHCRLRSTLRYLNGVCGPLFEEADTMNNGKESTIKRFKPFDPLRWF